MSEYPEIDAWWAEQMQILGDRIKCAAMECHEAMRALRPALDAVERGHHDQGDVPDDGSNPWSA